MTFFVLPVSSDTVFRPAVHLNGANLDLYCLTVGAKNRRVQALIKIEFRRRDVILEPSRHRVPPGVDRAERRVAVTDRTDKYAHAGEVVNLLKVSGLPNHLLIDRVVLFLTPCNLRLDLRGAKITRDGVNDFLNKAVALRCPLFHQSVNLAIQFRVECSEGKVFELPLDGLDSEPMREWNIDFKRFLSFALRRLCGNEAPRSCIVEAVCQLDQNYSNITRHGDDHLANGFRFRVITQLDLVELCHAVDEERNLITELPSHVVEGVIRVLDRVVQKRCRDRDRSDAEVDEHFSDGERVGDVRLPRTP